MSIFLVAEYMRHRNIEIVLFIALVLFGYYLGSNANIYESLASTFINEVINVNDQGNIKDRNRESKVITIYDDININLDNFENVKIGDRETDVIISIGKPSRIDSSEYGFKWYVYNENFSKLAMIGIQNNKVVALYSNSINTNQIDIDLESSRDAVRAKYNPLKNRIKNKVKYAVNSNDEYDLLKIKNTYVTVFYDIHENNKVTAYQIISKKVESKLEEIQTKGSDDLAKSFEAQSLDLVNSERDKRGLDILSYSEKATISSRKHSQDMIDKDYFDHVNKDEESPLDRMKKENINARATGENIAAGQTSAIFAHHALMNSLGHRKNILGNYQFLGTGVKFGGYYKIYYAQNFYRY